MNYDNISVLEMPFPVKHRPFSDKELTYRQKQTRKYFRLGQVYAQHSQCGHAYFTKLNSRKEKEIVENNDRDCGNCSVCWKLSRTPKELLPVAEDLVSSYQTFRESEPHFITFEEMVTEYNFYHWLYFDFSRD